MDIIYIIHITHLSLMEDWFKIWRFKINQTKSVHTTLTLKLTSPLSRSDPL